MSSDFDPVAFDDFEARGWNREGMARRYDSFLARVTDRVIDPLLDAITVARDRRVLDVGCGPGHLAARASERGAQAFGIDGAAEMVSYAASNFRHLPFCRADARRLPFADASVNAVAGNFMIFHVGQPEQAVTEFGRVLVPGGRVALTRWDAPERCRLLGIFVDATNSVVSTQPTSIPQGPPFFQSDDETGELLRAGGLHDVDVRRVQFRHLVADAEALWRGVLESTVRMAATLQDLSTEAREDVHATVVRLSRSFRHDDHLEVPVSVQLATARRA